MRPFLLAAVLTSLRFVFALIAVPGDYGSLFTCPSSGTFNVCDGDSLTSNLIYRCIDGCPQPGNCNDNLADVPPYGVKSTALCWQSSPTTGDAQCTIDCVKVTAANGTSFYPVGCSFQISDGNGSSITSPASTSVFVPTNTSPTSLVAATTSTTATSSQTGSADALVPPTELWGLLGLAMLVAG